MVRLDEARESARLIGIVAEQLADGTCRAPLAPFKEGDHTVSVVEAWRGPVWYWVLAGGQASVKRVKIVDPSSRNWPALEYAVLKNVVPDFPLSNKSFNLSYSGADLWIETDDGFAGGRRACGGMGAISGPPIFN